MEKQTEDFKETSNPITYIEYTITDEDNCNIQNVRIKVFNPEGVELIKKLKGKLKNANSIT
jgi:hypothetical protein